MPSTCSAVNCLRDVHSRGFCMAHYRRHCRTCLTAQFKVSNAKYRAKRKAALIMSGGKP